LQIVGKNGSNL